MGLCATIAIFLVYWTLFWLAMRSFNDCSKVVRFGIATIALVVLWVMMYFLVPISGTEGII
jgi:hypothetical protein